MTENLSYAQCLRVVGQDLDSLGIDSFELAKWGDDYIVWPKRTEPSNRGLLSKITEVILGEEDAPREIPNRLYFTSPEILSADVERRSRRKAGGPSDRRDISFVLRVLGDYLDRKRIAQFTVSWSRDSTTISYDQKQEIFTSQNIYDFGIRMYLRRSDRSDAK